MVGEYLPCIAVNWGIIGEDKKKENNNNNKK